MSRLAAILRSLHWRRGLRAGFAVAAAMLVCRLLNQPMGWAALGGFEAVIVDNGGPYRSRLYTIASVLLGGALCCAIGILAPQNILAATLITAAVCFAVTYARVASQPIANSAVVILVLYFAGFGASDHTLDYALASTSAYVLGGVGAGILSLFLWPVDPFRPARMEVARCFELLAEFAATIPGPSSDHTSHDDDHAHAVEFKRLLRSRMESARAVLSTTAARAPARTIRARNLSVLLETADMLFAVTILLTELAESPQAAQGENQRAALQQITQWLSSAERAIAGNLSARPTDNASSFAPGGSHRVQFIVRPASSINSVEPPPGIQTYLLNAQREALQNIEIAFDALHAVWTGVEPRPGTRTTPSPDTPSPAGISPGWLDALRENWTFASLMMRYALRIAVVGAIDVVLIRVLHISHGYWLAMTSIIVLQPYGFGTVRRSFYRVAGTIGGGVLAALLAATVHSYTGIIIVVTVCSVLTLATYAVHYGWYSFFLTPTFVLLTLPYLRDWRFAAVRVLTTFLGALTGVAAMRLLWPDSLSTELARLLARCSCACSGYTRSVMHFWQTPAAQRRVTERTMLAPARRACGLASQDAEEALDRIMLEPGFAQSPSAQTENALTFATYIRRFVACLTTLASVGSSDQRTVARLNTLSQRLDAMGASLALEANAAPCSGAPEKEPYPAIAGPILVNPSSLGEQMLQRMERQLGVLERATAAIVSSEPPAETTPQLQPTT